MSDTYDPDWKRQYIKLKGWDNMTEGQKYLATHPCNSSAMGMGMAGMKKELKRLQEELND